MRNLSVIANCHSLAIADMLTFAEGKISTDFIDVVFLETDQMQEKLHNLFKFLDQHTIISFPLSERFGRISSQIMRSIAPNSYRTFTNISFSGLHPDITYVGNMGGRLKAHFGDYHSKIILYCYSKGMSNTDCFNMFNAKTFEKIGYFDKYDASAAELRGRETACDIKFADEFLAMISQKSCLYTVNHPSGEVFFELSKKICNAINLNLPSFDPSFIPNHLSSNIIWPVYNEIAEYHSLPYRSIQFFINAGSRNGRLNTLSEFIDLNYAGYSILNHSQISDYIKDEKFYKELDARMQEG